MIFCGQIKRNNSIRLKNTRIYKNVTFGTKKQTRQNQNLDKIQASGENLPHTTRFYHTPRSPNIIYIIPNNNMATRGSFGLTHKGQTKMIYNHWDSYPEGLGREFVDWIKARSDDELKKHLII